ncbi:AfsR/SARP family transcriptional regulator [Dactylosporangium roseum]|uniref:AfsR/SARP family transcriptional regulator n=1 Tax=Dactylosporangium roseum TaxID=47989 RepID=A0ABY5ZCI1_9ACTN|nr:AfsR/SARP family transcriptional regulator [Dactylosporangium roseum]UWZ39572.1 AfsR/SARP family transcriptional regulator [Dactylosporangium roseum]
MAQFKIRFLGPLEFFDGTRWAPIRAAKQRALLAILLVNANRTVPVYQLIAELWGEKPPQSATGLLAGYVWRLRRTLGDPDGDILATRAPGYQLNVPLGAADVHDYEALTAAGRRSVAEGDPTSAVATFSAALDLWRGRPLADVPLGPSVLGEQARLEEGRLAVVEARIGAELGLGRHEALLPELKLMVSQYPLRERLHAHLMIALHRTGQQAEALGAYRDLRRLLIDELGIEPSKPLRDLHGQILREDLLPPQTAPGAGATSAVVRLAVPRTLPADVPAFVDRDDEVARITARLTSGAQRCAVHGLAGAGKTALALHAAHEVTGLFPDGQVYLDLGAGAAQVQLRPAEVIGRLLAALTVPATELPTDTERAAALLRTVLSGRRLLLVLDDVLDTAQIEHVLPAAPGSAVIIVGRPATAAVEGAGQIRLGRLPVTAAVELIRRYAGAERIDADRASAARIARACDNLPLALRIAATRLAQRPQWSVRDLADRLADPSRRLDTLACDGLSVLDSLRSGARLLQRVGDRAATRTLRMLGVLDLPVVRADALAVLLQESEAVAESTAERLVDAGLVETVSLGRYRIPELVRLWARAEYVTPDEERSGTRRVVEHYERVLRGLLDGRPADGAAWYRQERAALFALADRADGAALPGLVGQLRSALRHHRAA